jgi:hypothetical protein
MDDEGTIIKILHYYISVDITFRVYRHFLRQLTDAGLNVFRYAVKQFLF